MRRFSLAAMLALFLIPATVEAQVPRLMAGGGLSTPMGDFSDGANVGYHGRVGLQLGLPTMPLAGRVEAEYHSFGQPEGATGKFNVLNGSLSAVLSLEGTGLTPYFLAGVGLHRVSVDLGGISGSNNEPGFHGGFGVNIGALGFGGFAEFRVVQISTEGASMRYYPISVGFRL